MNKKYTPGINTNDIMGTNPFGIIVSTVLFNDRISYRIIQIKNQVIKLNQPTITEQN
ncbi:hypothetical protein [Flavobacterium sp. Root420]|uniref:hypothetical protein n=1 Tax=Flavobacterium sp. Root420 TaxID=1736533 RepID=UPI000B29E8B0|nr:hypothetical protein [Flavobacterium sp. Root420]